MKKIVILFGLMATLNAWSQVPTYKWVSGSQEQRAKSSLILTSPGARNGASSFTDINGNYYIFGGFGNDQSETQGFLNDLWKYDRSMAEWTWLDGQITADKEVPTYNNSLTFDGVNDKVVLDDNPVEYNQAFTVELWFKTDQDGTLISSSPTDKAFNNEGWSLNIVGGNAILVSKNYGDYVAQVFGPNLIDNEWHHIALTLNPGDDLFVNESITIYLDGNNVGNQRTNFIDNLDSNGDHITMIGASIGNGNESYFKGQIDEVRFWNYERNAGEIKSSRSIQLSGNEAGLVSYYNFNQGIANSSSNTESILLDISGGINGTLDDDIYRPGVFVGEMANVRVWSKALSSNEIKTTSETDVIGTELDLAMAFDFNTGTPGGDNTGETFTADLVGSNDGSFNNFDLIGESSNLIEDNLKVVPQIYLTQYDGRAVVTADLNNDTYDDVITANYDPQTINVFINDQAGNLNTPVTLAVGSYARELTVGFWNDDSFPDIAVAAGGVTTGDEKVRIFFGDGAGGFSSTADINLPLDSEPNEVRSADINGDTYEDLIVLLGGEDRIEIHYGDGTGNFPSSYSFNLIGEHYNKGLLIDDFTDDGFLDIATTVFYTGGCPEIGFHENDQTGGFSEGTYYPINGCLYLTEILSEDFNNDGNLDIVYYDGFTIGSIIGNGDGTFKEGTDLYQNQTEYYITGFTLTDINSDNITDMIITSDNQIVMFEGDGTGKFEESEQVNINFATEDIVATDLDHNGFIDFIVSHGWDRVAVVKREADYFDQATPKRSINFDGLNDFIDIPNLKVFDNSFTFEGWIKTEDNGPLFSFANQNELSEWNAGMFSIAIQEGRLSYLVNGFPALSSYYEYNLTNGEWHHVAVVVTLNTGLGDIDGVAFYIDGIENGTFYDYDFSGSIDNANGSFYSKLGYASLDFKDIIGTTGISPESNWVDGITFPTINSGRAYAAEWSDGETIYVFGGQGIEGIYNSLKSRTVASNSVCSSVAGLTYTYLTNNSTFGNDEITGSGTIGGTLENGYTFTDFSFGTYQFYYNVGDITGPRLNSLCNQASIVGNGNYGYPFSLQSPITRSPDGKSITFTWLSGVGLGATTTITLDTGTWPEISNNESPWNLLSGSDLPGDAGNYGTLNVSDPANLPPARYALNATMDINGNAWIFGGAANDIPNEWFNDLWKYDPNTNEWVWVSGESSVNGLAVYGSMGVGSTTNIPGPRSNHTIWSDNDGYVWIFGGYGLDSEGTVGYLNDLWKFDPLSLEWTWVGGSNLVNQGGNYGTIDLYSPTNMPGGRSASLQWIDSNGIIWIFGGDGYDKFGIVSNYLNDLWSYNPLSNEWAWHSGSDFAGSTGSYNETGLSSTEYVPGARWHSNGWVDENDDLWLFGGYKYNQLSTGLYNDFWKYEQTTKEWTWVSGFRSTAKINELGVYGDQNQGSKPHPGSRHGGLTWIDNKNNFWLLGGAELGSSVYGFYNDLWKYSPQKDEWTYINGDINLSLTEGVYGSKGIGSDTNVPKSRWHGASWTSQDGKLWFFGGINHNEGTDDIGWLNDLWNYDPESSTYTWMGGSKTINANGVYGEKGQASINHIPGARSSSAYWSDEEGNFWLFGGYESFEYNNDLWKFNPSTLEWTWVNGNNFQNSPSIYGELGVPNETNSIGARRYTDGRIDQDGNVWIFGGEGQDSQAQRDLLNDLWKYDPTTNIWTWMSGPKLGGQPGNYGTKGVSSPDNLPPPRYSHSMWIDDSGNIWIFGGYGRLDNTSPYGNFNDLWKFDVKTSEWTWMGGSDQIGDVGIFGVQGEFSESNKIPAKARALTFSTYDKSLWLFGGRNGPSFNDFWQIKFTPDVPFVELPSTILQNSFAFTYDEAWARGYRVQVALSDDFSDVFHDETSANKESVINNLQPGTNYYYHVGAINEIGNSGFGPTQQVLTLPATPTFASLALALSEITPVQATLNWEITPGVLDGYYLDISQDPTFTDPSKVHEDFDAKSIAITQQQVILNLLPGTQYYARLRSFNASGESPYSQTVPFLTKPATPTFDSETVVSEVSQSSLLLSWNPVPEVLAGYRLTISSLNDGFADANGYLPNYSGLNINKTRNSLQINGLQPGTPYFGYLVAVNSSGESDQSELINMLTTPASPVFDVETSIINITQNAITFNWEAPIGLFNGYYLEVSTDFSFANPNLMLQGYGRNGVPFELGQSDLSTTVTGLLPGQSYFARIRAFNSAGVSPNSNILTFTTVPRAPTLNNANNITQNGASLNWQAIQGSDVYLMDLNTSTGFEEATSLFTNFPLAVPFQVLTDLTPGTRYYTRVQSSNISGNSGEMDPPDYGYTEFITIPGTPVLNGVDGYTQTSFTVSWPAVEGAAGYEVDVSDNFFQTFLVGFNSATITEPTITVGNLDQGSEYQIRVRAKNESGKSPYVGIFDLLTLPETPIARDATNSSASVFTANWDPSDGADYYVLEVSTDDFGTFHYNEQLSSSNPVQITDLTAGKTYKYRVKSGNVSGESPYSNSVTVVAQNTAQSLNISSLTYNDEFGENATSAVINVKFSGGSGNPNVSIRHKEILSNNWSAQKPMTEISPTEFEFTILSNMLDDIGVVFEIYADDGITFIKQLNNTIKRTFSETNSEALPPLILGEWSMVSIPYVLEDNLVTSIFNELGDLAYKKKWRLMTYLDGEYQDQGVGFTRIDLGRGYWFNSLNDVEINVGAGQTNSTIPFEMALNQGWNQIGNPYNVDINWDRILDDNSLPINISKLIVYDPADKEFKESSTLSSFQGAFVFADQAAIVAVNPAANSSTGRQIKDEQLFEGLNWKKSINLEWGGKTREVAAIGMHDAGKMSKDQFDQLVIPRFENYLEMYTTDDSYFYPRFSKDIKSQRDEYVWHFDLESNFVSGYISLQWDASLLERGYLWLVDEDAGRIVKMDDQHEYAFNFNEQHAFSIHYSTNPNYRVVPSKLTLGDAYPNPVNSMAYIPVFLPERDQPYDLKLNLFDIQGKLVKTIATGEYRTGVHIFELDINNDIVLKDGLYFYKVSFDGDHSNDQQKKIFIRR